MGSGAAGQRMVNLKVDVVKEVSVGLCFVSRSRRLVKTNGNKSKQRIRLPRRHRVEVILAQVHRCAAGACGAARRTFRVGAVFSPWIHT